MSRDAQYLVNPGEDSDVEGALAAEAVEARVGRLFSLSFDEVSVLFDPQGARGFPVGRPVTVSLHCDRLGDDVHIPGSVQSRRDEEHRSAFCVRFEVDGDEGKKLRRRLAKLNRRKEVRVSPEDAEPVRVALRPATLGADGEVAPSEAEWNSDGLEVHDLSFHGACLTAPADLDLSLARSPLAEVRLGFPDGDSDTILVGLLRNRTLEGSTIRYGVEFMAQHTREWLSQEEAVSDYVWRRMRTLFGIQDGAGVS